MENSLDSILSGSPVETPTPEVVQPEQVQQPQTEEVEQQDTGEQETGTPPEQQREDPLEKHRKGLEAAATAERRKRQEAETALAQARQELEALRRQPKPHPAPQQQQQDEDPKPQRAQYQSEDEWLDARDAWRDRQTQRQYEQQEQQRAELEARTKTESVIAQAMTLPGFELQKFLALPVSQPMADAILDSDAGGQLVHFLTANPDECRRIASLPNPRQIKELARIEDKLSATQATESDDEPVTKPKPQLPNTLTQARNAKGQFEPAYSGPTPLNAILSQR